MALSSIMGVPYSLPSRCGATEPYKRTPFAQLWILHLSSSLRPKNVFAQTTTLKHTISSSHRRTHPPNSLPKTSTSLSRRAYHSAGQCDPSASIHLSLQTLTTSRNTPACRSLGGQRTISHVVCGSWIPPSSHRLGDFVIGSGFRRTVASSWSFTRLWTPASGPFARTCILQISPKGCCRRSWKTRCGYIGLKHWCALLEEKRTNWISLVECLSGVIHRTGAASTDFLHPDDVRAAAEEAVQQRRPRQKRTGASGGGAGSHGRDANGSASANTQAPGNASRAPSAGNGAGQGKTESGPKSHQVRRQTTPTPDEEAAYISPRAPQLASASAAEAPPSPESPTQPQQPSHAALRRTDSGSEAENRPRNGVDRVFKRPNAKRVRIATSEEAPKRTLEDVDGRAEMPNAKRAKRG